MYLECIKKIKRISYTFFCCSKCLTKESVGVGERGSVGTLRQV